MKLGHQPIGRLSHYYQPVAASVGRRACGPVDVGTCPHQVLAATLTASQPDYAHTIQVYTPCFESHRCACF